MDYLKSLNKDTFDSKMHLYQLANHDKRCGIPYNHLYLNLLYMSPISKALAKSVGLQRAMVCNLIGFCIQYPSIYNIPAMRVNKVHVNKQNIYGHKWIKCPLALLHRATNYESTRSLIRQIDWLKRHNLLFSVKFNKKHGDRTSWYAINADKYNQLMVKEAVLDENC